jgi:hypothetical protein
MVVILGETDVQPLWHVTVNRSRYGASEVKSRQAPQGAEAQAMLRIQRNVL